MAVPTTYSATLSALAPVAGSTGRPRARQASTSMLSRPTPRRPTTRQRVSASSSLPRTWVRLRTMNASAPAASASIRGASSTSAGSYSTSWAARSRSTAGASMNSVITTRLIRGSSGALEQAGQHELAVAQGLGRGQAPVGGAQHALQQLVTGLVQRDAALQQVGRVHVDVLAHQAHRARVRADLDDRHDRVADHVALARGEEVNHVARGGAQRHHLGRGGGAVHEPQARVRGHLGLVDHAVDRALFADLLDVAQRFLLDGGQAAGD